MAKMDDDAYSSDAESYSLDERKRTLIYIKMK